MGFNTGKHLYPRLYSWMIPLIPKSVTPNSITAVNIGIQLLYLVRFVLLGQHDWLWFGATLLIYRILDNVDGMHARATQQCSVFGEFLDHSFDAFYEPVLWFLALEAVGFVSWANGVLVFVYPATMLAHYLAPKSLYAARTRSLLQSAPSVKAPSARHPAVYNVESAFGPFCDEDVLCSLLLAFFLPAWLTYPLMCLLMAMVSLSGLDEVVHGGGTWRERLRLLVVPGLYLTAAWWSMPVHPTPAVVVRLWVVGHSLVTAALITEAWRLRFQPERPAFGHWAWAACCVALPVVLPDARLLAACGAGLAAWQVHAVLPFVWPGRAG